MKIATWNVNSIRTRLEHLVGWLEDNPVDVLCVQETKVVDQDFPRSLLEALGYHVYVSGQKSYNGVALLSRSPLTDVSMGFTPILGAIVGDLDDQKRVITGVLDGVRIIDLYVPNGSAIGSEKYGYKLRWLGMLRNYLKVLMAQHPNLLVCGDFNIAPEDRDIHDPTGREQHIMASDIERQALQQAIFDLGLSDAFRKFNPEAEQFTWWDYRAAAFRRNLGWRIDHHYLSPSLYEQAKSCDVDITPRKLEKPSDHAPVIVEI
jgi:exodeoxyribonuclease III